jgi:ribonuclease HI
MKKIIIFTDGGARGNPGPAGAGAVICNEKGEKMKEYGKYLGDNLTNNEAEYMAAIFGLEKFKASFGKRLAKEAELTLCVDSELLAKQMQGKYKIENEKLQPLFLKLWNARLDFKSFKIKHVVRSKNKDADRMVNQALDDKKKQEDSKLF